MFENGLHNEAAFGLCADNVHKLRQALADLGRVLIELAGAQGEKPGQSHVTTCHYSPNPLTGYTITDLMGDFLRTKAKTGRSDRYLRALRVSLKSFCRDRKHMELGNVTVADVEAWLDAQDWSPRTKKGYLSDVRVMFNYAVKRRMLEFNPAAAVELPIQDNKPPAIHTPGQVRTVLEFARGYSLPICRALAIRYFAGLRSAETNRLEEVYIKEQFIEVTAANAKTRRRRLVEISPNLRAWLQLGGTLPVHDINNRWRWFTGELKKAHGISWQHNVTRHSFVSYHLARGGSAARTALEAGHTEQMLFAHYRELVTPAAAAEFWNITPTNNE